MTRNYQIQRRKTLKAQIINGMTKETTHVNQAKTKKAFKILKRLFFKGRYPKGMILP